MFARSVVASLTINSESFFTEKKKEPFPEDDHFRG